MGDLRPDRAGRDAVAREKEFVEAARALGDGTATILFRTILPNIVAPLTVIASFNVASVILTEAALSFLGLGVPASVPTWGSMLAESRDTLLANKWWLAVFPGLAIMLTVLSFNIIGRLAARRARSAAAGAAMRNRDMKVGIIGASFAQAAYLPALRHVPGAEVVAIASARLSSAQAAATAFGVPHAYDDWRQMLAAHAFDLVCIATPTVQHAPQTLAAIAAGAHVLCEKPTAMNAAEAARMLAAAEAAGRVHMIDHELRFNPNRARIAALIADGTLGEMRHVVITNIGTPGTTRPAARRATGGAWPIRAAAGSAPTAATRWTCCAGGWARWPGLPVRRR